MIEADEVTRLATGALCQIDLRGYRRADMIGPIYQGKFDLTSPAGLDNIRYYAQTAGDLAAKCPGLHLESAQFELFPYIISGVTDLMSRLGSGQQATQSEMLEAVWFGIVSLN